MVVHPGLEPELPRYEGGVIAAFTSEPWSSLQESNLFLPACRAGAFPLS